MTRNIKKPKLKGINRREQELSRADQGSTMQENAPEAEEDEIVDTVGAEEDDVYEDRTDERLVDEDEISPGEAAFMEGYTQPKLILCRNKCGEAVDVENPVVREIKGAEHYFCSEECAEEFAKKGYGRQK